MRKAPFESKIKNLLGDSASMEIALAGIILVDFEVSNSLPLNVTKHTPSSGESCLNLTDRCLAARFNTPLVAVVKRPRAIQVHMNIVPRRNGSHFHLK